MLLSVDVAPDVVAALQNRVAVREARHAVAHAVRALLSDDLAGHGLLLTGSDDNAVVTEG
jgi:Arc/MetJ family transcription regulator